MNLIYHYVLHVKLRELSAQNVLKYSVTFGLHFNDYVYFVPFEPVVINYSKKKNYIKPCICMTDAKVFFITSVCIYLKSHAF